MEVIDDSQWSEVEPGSDRYLYAMSDIYTLDELSEAVDKEYEAMSEDEKHLRTVHGDPTYLQWALSSVSRKIQPGQKVEVDELNYRYRIIKE